MQTHGVHPSKALGQNFVHDANVLRRIVRLAEIKPGDAVIEIGAGLGSLTLALLDAGAAVTTIEFDKYLIPVLCELLGERARVIHADALELDWASVVEGGDHLTVVANLPYNVGTAIVTKLLEEVPQISRMVVMLQKEVAQRMCAKPRTKAYGALTVKIAYYAHAEVIGTIPRTVFIPQPDVDSALIDIRRRDRPPTEAPTQPLFALVHAGFSQRRKMLRSSLSKVQQITFDRAGVVPSARAEELSIEDWGRLTIEHLGNEYE